MNRTTTREEWAAEHHRYRAWMRRVAPRLRAQMTHEATAIRVAEAFGYAHYTPKAWDLNRAAENRQQGNYRQARVMLNWHGMAPDLP